MPRTPIANIALRPRQGVLWNEHFDPGIVVPDEVSGRRDTLFFGLHPPLEIAGRAYRIGRDFRKKNHLHCSLTKPECLHVTTLGIGRYEELSRTTMNALHAAAASVALRPFLIELNEATSFDNKHDWPFVLTGDDRTIPGIVILRQKLVSALHGEGFRELKSPSFTPHMTLFYGRRDLGEWPIEELCWTVQDFVLIHSLYGKGQHKVLGRWQLRG